MVRVPRTDSTNATLADALRRADPDDGAWPHLGVLVTDHQAAGRGRSGRGWVTPPGVALTASVVLRPEVPVARWSWLSLLGGLAVVRAIRATTDLPAALKWPNDVVLIGVGDRAEPGWGRDRKVAGVLAEVVHLPDGTAAAVVGFGINVHSGAADLPVAWAASLSSAGAPPGACRMDVLLDAVGHELVALTRRWADAAGDAAGTALAAEVAAACSTLGRQVRVSLPGGGSVTGLASDLADDGALLVRPASGPEVRVTAGDVDHIRTLGTG